MPLTIAVPIIGSGAAAGTPDDNTVSTAKLQPDAVTNSKMANMLEARMKGRAVGAGTGDPTDLTAEQTRVVAIGTEIDDGNSSTADTIDWSAGPNHRSTLTGNCTYTFTAPGYHGDVQLKVIQDATGSRTVTWPVSVFWPQGTPPTLSTAANAVDLVTFYYDGTHYFGRASAGATGRFS